MSTNYNNLTKADLIKKITDLETKVSTLETDSRTYRSQATSYEKRAWLLSVAFIAVMIALAFAFGGPHD